MCDVLYTRDAPAFQEMVMKAIVDRKKKIEESQNQLVEMKPEFEAALKKCITFSCKDNIFFDSSQRKKESQHFF